MKFIRQLVLLPLLVLMSTNASALSVDFRQEYKQDSQVHASRVKMGGTLANNVAMSLELKFKGEDGEFLQNMQSNGAELDVGYHYKINEQWTLSPGMPVEFSNENATYKPQIRLTYRPEAISNFSISARYRLDVKPHETTNRYRHRYTTNLAYKHNRWDFGLELNYYYSDNADYHLYDNKRTNYENNLTIRYAFNRWSPWFEIGDVSVSDDSDKRELRSRIGIRYRF
ncbi:oligogalacturonate-specific porin KdgM family protein [Shewanella maritima]|uniref:oligogalacturonate-specific porin KdgM family protein n=1 Tax=Shewanella maritima TaxID=2520507 RepID=UPI003735D0A9